MPRFKGVVRRVGVGLAIWSIGCASHPRRASGPEPAAPSSLETYIGEVRRLSLAARAPKPGAATLESSDAELGEALRNLAVAATAPAERRVADAYRHAGVLDAAFSHYSAAILLDRRDAASYDGLARVWRDLGAPARGVGDARRAIFYAPESAEVYNTFGTLLYALGQKPEARQAFERAVTLAPTAVYAWTNLCYTAFQSGNTESALTNCRRAIDLEPALTTAHNDLGLVYAARGDLEAAAAEFALAGGDAAREYNVGIVLLASGKPAEATKAFEAARTLRPGWKSATDRARQSRRLALQATAMPREVPSPDAAP